MQDALADRGVTDAIARDIDVRAYIFDMPKVMAAADLILCRAGASTLAELTAMGKPAILVPSPHVANNHQEENARALKMGGGAVMLREAEASGEVLYRTVTELLDAPERLDGMAQAMRRMGRPDAAEEIVKIVLGIVKA